MSISAAERVSQRTQGEKSVLDASFVHGSIQGARLRSVGGVTVKRSPCTNSDEMERIDSAGNSVGTQARV